MPLVWVVKSQFANDGLDVSDPSTTDPVALGWYGLLNRGLHPICRSSWRVSWLQKLLPKSEDTYRLFGADGDQTPG